MALTNYGTESDPDIFYNLGYLTLMHMRERKPDLMEKDGSLLLEMEKKKKKDITQSEAFLHSLGHFAAIKSFFSHIHYYVHI